MMDNFLNVKDVWPDMEIFKLQINYRSKPHIVNASNHIIKNNLKQYDKKVTAHRSGNDKIVIMQHGDEIDEAKHTIELIAKIKEINSPSSIAKMLFLQYLNNNLSWREYLIKFMVDLNF